MSKDSLFDISSHKKYEFPTRISSKVPIKIAMHSRNNSFEEQYSYKSEKNYNNDISIVKINAIHSRNPKEESICSSYYSFFSSEKEPLNTTNSSFEYNESVTMAVLNLDCYSKLNHSSKESSDFEPEDLNRILSNDKENSKSYTLEPHANVLNSNKEKIIKLHDNEMIFSPDDSPIIIPDKPSYNKIDTSKSILFNNSNIYLDNISSSGSYSSSGKRKFSIKNSRNIPGSTNSSPARKPNKKYYNDQTIYNSDNQISDIRSSSLPRNNIDVHSLNYRVRSSTLPTSINKNSILCISPKIDSNNIQDNETSKIMDYGKTKNYNLNNDDNDSFVYNQSEHIPNHIKSKNNDILDSSDERRYRSLSRKHRNHRSSSKNNENDKPESKGRSRSKSKSKLERQNSQSESRYRSLSRNRKGNKEGENRFHSLSRSRSRSKKNSKEDESRYRSISRSRKESRDDEKVEKEKERKRSTSRHKKCHKRNKSPSNHSSPLVKSSPSFRSNNNGSNVGNPLVKKNSLIRNNSHDHDSNLGISLSRNNSHDSRNNSHINNNGSPLVRKESYRSPLASNSVINNKFSTDYIQNDYSKSPYDSKKHQNIENLNKIKNNNYNIEEDKKNNNSSTNKSIGDTQNLDILNEICDLKKFSQDFSGLNILESILNKPIEDDFEFLNYKKEPENKYNNKKYSTLSRLQTKRNKPDELKRRNSDNDFNKSHNRTKSDQIRNDENNNGNSNSNNKNNNKSKRSFFNFFSHKKSKSYSNSEKESEFDKMIKGNETIKITLQPINKYGLSYSERTLDDYNNDSHYDSGMNNEEFRSSYNNLMKEKMMNQQQKSYNQEVKYGKNYTPLFKINMISNTDNHHHHYNNMEFYGTTMERATNPYDQFNSFSTDESDRNYVKIGNRNSSLNRYNKYGRKRIIY